MQLRLLQPVAIEKLKVFRDLIIDYILRAFLVSNRKPCEILNPSINNLFIGNSYKPTVFLNLIACPFFK